MTSFIIEQFVGRETGYNLVDACRFCRIIKKTDKAYILYEDDHVIAFLDTLPIRPGHTLLVPKAHYDRLTDLPPELGSALGSGLIKIGDALTKGMDNPDLNFVCNQGYAQAVHHVHFHLVPAPVFNSDSVFKPKPAPLPSPVQAAIQPTEAATQTPESVQSAENPLAAIAESAVPEQTNETVAQTNNASKANADIFKLERARREELDDEDAVVIAERIRSRL